MTATATETIAEWASGLRLTDIPVAVREAALRHILDGLGTAIAAGRRGEARAAVEVAGALGGPPEASLFGTGRKVSAAGAALATGALVHALDFDDTHPGALVHPTSVVLPVALAVGEELGSEGSAVLVAAVAGYETVTRLGAAAPHAFHSRGLHATSACGVFSAALVSSLLMGLSPDRTAAALGLAGSGSSGLLEFLHTGSASKAVHAGMASHWGVLAARLAQAGTGGPRSILEGDFGLYRSLAGTKVEPESITGTLGSRWEVTGVGIKPYPACQLSHASLDAALQLAPTVSDGADVAEVVVDLPPESVAIVAAPAEAKVSPGSSYAAKFSVQWSVAAMLLDGRVGIDTFDRPGRPDVLSLAQRVTVRRRAHGGPPASAPGRVEVRWVGGRVALGEVPSSSGTPQSPLSDAEVLRKFTANTAMADEEARLLASQVLDLAGVQSLAGIVDSVDQACRSEEER